MKLKNNFKRIFAAIMIFTMFLSGINILTGKTTANASSNPVKMYCMDHYFSRYGICQYTVYIEVDANSARNKEVYVHHSSSDGWVDTKADFLTKLDNNTEIWEAKISGVATDDYVIKYVGDGNTYWDNNNGKNYNMSNVAGSANVKAIRRFASQPSSLIRVVVQNLAYEKVVKVRFTQDNWNTYKDVNLSYVSSTSGTNEELWSVNLDLDPNKTGGFYYCICYEVNGQTYWDNNFGKNYDSSYNRGY